MNKSRTSLHIFLGGVCLYLLSITGIIANVHETLLMAALGVSVLMIVISILYSLQPDTIYFAKLNKAAKIPTRENENGWYDIYACSDKAIIIEPHTNKLIPTGIASAFASNYRIVLKERGSNTKSNMILMAGCIDSGYTGEYFVSIYNESNIPVEITNTVSEVEVMEDYIRVPMSKAICQAAIEFVPNVKITETTIDKIKTRKTSRGDGKLGSSGK